VKSRAYLPRVWAVVCLGLCLLCTARPASAQEEEAPPRDARFEWDASRRFLYVGLSFRDAVDATIQKKLGRGLPTTIVFTAALYRAGSEFPVATTAQTCKVTWHVWQEVYLVEVTRPGSHRVEKTLTINGVLRRCAEIPAQNLAR
jgi:hypothetical protein